MAQVVTQHGATSAYRRAAVGFGVLDGVRACVAATPGPTRATLLLRVGVADETPRTRGFARLGLAAAIAQSGVAPCVEVGVLTTRVTFEGPTVADEVGRLTEALGRPTHAAIAAAREALLAAPAVCEPAGAVLRLRAGLQGWGLLGLPELGLHRTEPDAVQEWWAGRAVTGQAVIVITGANPGMVRLRLPAGPTRGLPATPGALGSGPRVRSGSDDELRLGAVLPGDACTAALAATIAHEVDARLGAAGVVQVTTDRVAAEERHLLVTAESGPSARRAGAVVAGVLDDVRRGEVGTDGLDRLRGAMTRRVMEPTAPDLETQALEAAEAALLGLPAAPSPMAFLQELREGVGLADVRQRWEVARAGLTGVVPAAVRALYPADGPARVIPPVIVVGSTFPGRSRRAVVVGEDGVAWRERGHQTEMLSAFECAVAERRPGGRWTLHALDGWALRLDTGEWRRSAQLDEALRRLVGADRLVEVDSGTGPRRARRAARRTD